MHVGLHKLSDARDAGISGRCVFVRYRRVIMVYKERVMGSAVEIKPTDHWLHAMDPSTNPQASQIRSQCNEETCVNYCRRR